MFQRIRNKVGNWLSRGNPNVTVWGFGDLLYCQKCNEVVSTVYHTCNMNKQDIENDFVERFKLEDIENVRESEDYEVVEFSDKQVFRHVETDTEFEISPNSDE